MFTGISRFFASTSKNLRIYKGYLLPAPPKRPINPMNRFIMVLKESGRKINLKENVEQWKNLSDAEKKPFQDAFASQRQEYEQEKKDYEKLYIDHLPIAKGSSYSQYLQTQFKKTEGDGRKPTEKLASIAKQWRSLPDSEKKKLKESYSAEQAKKPADNTLERLRIPEDNRRSAITFFNEENKKSGKNAKWSEIKEADRKVYEDKAKESEQNYNKSFDSFLKNNGLTPKEFAKLVKKSQRSSSQRKTSSDKTSSDKTRSESEPKRSKSVKSTEEKTTKPKKTLRKKNLEASKETYKAL